MTTIHRLDDYRCARSNRPPREPMHEVRMTLEYQKRRQQLQADTEAANALAWRELRANLLAAATTVLVLGGLLLGALLQCMP